MTVHANRPDAETGMTTPHNAVLLRRGMVRLPLAAFVLLCIVCPTGKLFAESPRLILFFSAK